MSDADQSSAPLIPAAAARAGDADREAVADRLRIAAGDGRFDLAELDERLTQAYAAKTYGQLQVLVADLPAHSVAITGVALPEPDTLVLKTKALRWSAAGSGAYVGSALRDGENEPLLAQDSNGPADGVAADVVFLSERGLRRERVQPRQFA